MIHVHKEDWELLRGQERLVVVVGPLHVGLLEGQKPPRDGTGDEKDEHGGQGGDEKEDRDGDEHDGEAATDQVEAFQVG